MAGVLVADKENLTPSGTLSANPGKRPNEWSHGNDESAKRKALLRPSTRFTNVKENSSNVNQPSKPSAMGPPPPRIAAFSSDASSGVRPKLVAQEQRKATVVSVNHPDTFKICIFLRACTNLSLKNSVASPYMEIGACLADEGS